MTENKAKTDRPGRFKPGTSGNPGGRPKRSAEEVALVEAARSHSKRALDVVLDIMVKGQSERVRLSAALAVIERGCGKPGDVMSSRLTLADGADMAEQARAVVNAAVGGELPMQQAATLLSAIASLAKIVETQDHAARIAALENAREKP